MKTDLPIVTVRGSVVKQVSEVNRNTMSVEAGGMFDEVRDDKAAVNAVVTSLLNENKET